MGKPTLDQILVSLKNEVLMGRAYLTIAKGLQRADHFENISDILRVSD